MLLLVVAGLGLNRRLVAGLGCDGHRRGSRFLEPSQLLLTLTSFLCLSLYRGVAGVGQHLTCQCTAAVPSPQLAVHRSPLYLLSLGFGLPGKGIARARTPLCSWFSHMKRGLWPFVLPFSFLFCCFGLITQSTKITSPILNVLF